MSEQEFAFCEPSWATTSSREHIRAVGPDGLHFGGGIKTPPLCSTDLGNGWDLKVPVDAHTIRAGLGADLNPTCPECAALWTEEAAHE